MNFAFKSTLLAILLNGLMWILVIPVWQYPDEQAHFSQIQNYAEIGFVPSGKNTSLEIFSLEKAIGTDRDEFGNNTYTYHPEKKMPTSSTMYSQDEITTNSLGKDARVEFVIAESTNNPPHYYWLGALAYKTVYNGNLFTRIYAVRFLSVLLNVIFILVTLKISELIFKKDNFFKLSLLILIAFMPMFVFSSTGILPDPLTNLLFTILILISLKILIYGIRIQYLLSLSAVILLGILTRQHFLISIPICALAIFFQVSKNIKQLIYFAVILFLISFLIILLNFVGTAIPLLAYIRIPDAVNFERELFSFQSFFDHILWTLNHTYHEVLPWYWGVYKWLSLTMPHIFYRVINVLLVLSVAGIFIRFVRVVRHKKVEFMDKIVIFMILSSLVYFVFFLIWDYFFRSKNLYSFGVQGRYYFPLIVAHFVVILIGLRQLFTLILKKFTNWAIFLLALLMVLFNDFTLGFVAFSYYKAESFSSLAIELSQYKPFLLKGNIIFVTITLALIAQVLMLYSYSLLARNNNTDIMT